MSNFEYVDTESGVLSAIGNIENDARSIYRNTGVLRSLEISGKLSIELSIHWYNWQNSDHEVEFQTICGNHNRVGVTKVLVEWCDYQSECFGELIYTKSLSIKSKTLSTKRKQSSKVMI